MRNRDNVTFPHLTMVKIANLDPSLSLSLSLSPCIECWGNMARQVNFLCLACCTVTSDLILKVSNAQEMIVQKMSQVNSEFLDEYHHSPIILQPFTRVAPVKDKNNFSIDSESITIDTGTSLQDHFSQITILCRWIIVNCVHVATSLHWEPGAVHVHELQ